MRGEDEYSDLERSLASEASRLGERSFRRVDTGALLRRAEKRRSRSRAWTAITVFTAIGGLVALQNWASDTWTDGTRTSVRGPVAAVVPPKHSSRSKASTEGQFGPARPTQLRSSASIRTDETRFPRTVEVVVVAPDGGGERVVGRYECRVATGDSAEIDGAVEGFSILTTPCSVNLSELSGFEQSAVRRLFGIDEPSTDAVTF